MQSQILTVTTISREAMCELELERVSVEYIYISPIPQLVPCGKRGGGSGGGGDAAVVRTLSGAALK
jgi:hypothetical protein